jgi:hypothetical protein
VDPTRYPDDIALITQHPGEDAEIEAGAAAHVGGGTRVTDTQSHVPADVQHSTVHPLAGPLDAPLTVTQPPPALAGTIYHGGGTPANLAHTHIGVVDEDGNELDLESCFRDAGSTLLIANRRVLETYAYPHTDIVGTKLLFAAGTPVAKDKVAELVAAAKAAKKAEHS